MNSFFRFTLTILIVGILVNLAVVFAANAQSQRRQGIQDAADRAKLKAILDNPDLITRHLDAIVESQRFDQDNKAIETTLLLRQYHSPGIDQSVPNAVQRIVIPGDRLKIYGAILRFSDEFAADAPEFQIMRKKTLVYFTYACGEEETPVPHQPDDLFTFMPEWETPELTRLDIFTLRPTIFEVRLWKYIWNHIPDEHRTPPWASDWKNGISVTYIAPAVAPGLRPQSVYSATVSTSGEYGTIFWETPINDPLKVREIIAQRRYQESPTQPTADLPKGPAPRP